MEIEILDLLERVGLDSDFMMVNYDSDAESDLLTNAPGKYRQQPVGKTLNLKAAVKYEKIHLERLKREAELKRKVSLANKYNGSQLYQSTRKGGSSQGNNSLDFAFRNRSKTRLNLDEDQVSASALSASKI